MATWTEFYTNASTGSNLYAGSTTGAPLVTYASGSWVQATGVFTVASGNPVNDGVAVGHFASVYPDATTPNAVFVGRITARDATTITVSLTAMSGAAPINGTNDTTLVVGGVWKGPNAASGFPLSFVTNALTDGTADHYPRINMKSNAAYAITTGITSAGTGPICIEGYKDNAGDELERATISTASAIVLLTISGIFYYVRNLIFASTATSGTAHNVTLTGVANVFARCVSYGARNDGFSAQASGSSFTECEAYDCNKANTAGRSGFRSTAVGNSFERCVSHDNTGSNTSGFSDTAAGGSTTVFRNCISDTNGADGFYASRTGGSTRLVSCDFYNNTGDGCDIANATIHGFRIESCNFVKNGGYGINGSGAGARIGSVVNCGFGAGTQANTSGTTTGLKSMVESGSVTYADDVTPWVDPANGDFRINLAAAQSAGRGAFTQTAASYTGTVGYPDIGAAQHAAQRWSPLPGLTR